MRSVKVNEFGAPDVLVLGEAEAPEPGPGQLLVEVTVSGVNFLDTYQRRGETPLQPPFSAGVEGVGVIVALGSHVDDFAVGDRVGWLAGGQGSFSDLTVVEAGKAVPLPEGLEDETAVAVLMQGITAHYLSHDTYSITASDVVVVHAAAGGVGQLLTQVAKLRGATVVGTVSSAAKADVARSVGADVAVGYDDLMAAVEQASQGRGAAVVYDGVGAATFESSLNALGRRGHLVSYGAASGPPPQVSMTQLKIGGSLFVTRPTVVDYIATPEELRSRAADVFAWAARGDISVSIGGRYDVVDVAEAFTALESRSTTGKLIVHRGSGRSGA